MLIAIEWRYIFAALEGYGSLFFHYFGFRMVFFGVQEGVGFVVMRSLCFGVT